MRVKFLQTTPSAAPGAPFQIGQIITLQKLTPEVRSWVAHGMAEILEERNEATSLGPAPEVTVLEPPRRRGSR